MNPYEDMYERALTRARLYLMHGNERGCRHMIAYASWLLDAEYKTLKEQSMKENHIPNADEKLIGQLIGGGIIKRVELIDFPAYDGAVFILEKDGVCHEVEVGVDPAQTDETFYLSIDGRRIISTK